MTIAEIASRRLISQKISKTTFKSPKEIVTWMGAMQAQDYAMARWAIGSRMLNASDKKIETSFNRGEIIRTHLMRPTWHFVAAEDIYWMLDLTSPQIRSAMTSRHKNLEISTALLSKTFYLIERALRHQKDVTREELTKVLHTANIRTDDNRLAHLMLLAELEGLVCSGPVKNNKPTYALLHERVPMKKLLSRDESLTKLAKRYFTSHGPATIKDFTWWSGLSLKDCRNALESVKSDLIPKKAGDEVYWLTDTLPGAKSPKTFLFLLPSYDEFLISYRDRSASLSLAHTKTAVSSNGIFRPVIIVNGQVTGLWRKLTKENKVQIVADFFQKPGKEAKDLFTEQAHRLGKFLNKPVEIKY